MLCLRHILARPTSERPNSLARVRIGVFQTRSYSCFRVNSTDVTFIEIGAFRKRNWKTLRKFKVFVADRDTCMMGDLRQDLQRFLLSDRLNP